MTDGGGILCEHSPAEAHCVCLGKQSGWTRFNLVMLSEQREDSFSSSSGLITTWQSNLERWTKSELCVSDFDEVAG